MNQPRINIKWYVIADTIAAITTWICFYYLRTLIYHCHFHMPPGFYIGVLLFTTGWLCLHLLSGAYNQVYHKKVLDEFFRTAIVSIIGCLILLFFFILKNPHENNEDYYLEFYYMLLSIFLFTFLFRLPFLKKVQEQLKSGKVFFNVLLIGSGSNADQFVRLFAKSKEENGFRLTSFINTNHNNDASIPADITKYYSLDKLNEILVKQQIEEIIISVDKTERSLLTNILRRLSDKDVNIKITPDKTDILSGTFRTSNILGVPLIDVHSGQLQAWQKNIKRLIDLLLSVIAFILLSPLLIYTAIRTKFSSKGPVLYLQERIGFKGKPFIILKFRSMVVDAEPNGPALSCDDDPRITRWGKTMRKWRLDELPQLWNIILGDMSLVGPRPERKFYIDQIVREQPEYNFLFKVKPGLTSWGMVKYGYASSVEEMIQRMQFDLMYIENVSIFIDIKIMLQTLRIIFAGKGK